MDINFFLKRLITSIFRQIKKFKNNENNFRTLMYHSIIDDENMPKNKNKWKLSISIFKDQIKFIKYEKIKIYPTLALINKIPKKGLAITFDDGYENTYKLAAPYLIKQNIPFTIFIVTNYIKKNKKGYMNENMLKNLSSNPLVTIGSHTKNHYDLTTINSKTLENELSYSKLYLEDIICKKVDMLSYPYGKYNRMVKEKVLKAGYKLAFTSNFNKNFEKQDKIGLARNEIWNTDIVKFFNEKLNGSWDWLQYRSL